jgi:hypothetical protein
MIILKSSLQLAEQTPYQLSLSIPDGIPARKWAINLTVGSFAIAGVTFYFFGTQIFGVCALALGLSVLFSQFEIACQFNKMTGKLSFKRVGILKTSICQYAISDIQSIQLIKGTDSDGYKCYTTKLVLRSGRAIVLALDPNHSDPPKIAQTLQNFLVVPLEVKQDS